MSRRITKSRYLMFKTCPKSLWLSINIPELAKEDAAGLKNIEDGKAVGALAKSYFPDTLDTSSYDEEGKLDINNMIGLTNRYLAAGGHVIAEACFSIDDLYCAIDLLKPVEDGYEIYEVKATTKIAKEHYIDAAFQKYVLTKKGMNVKAVYIMHIDNGYIRHGDIDVQKLFMSERVDQLSPFTGAYEVIERDIEKIKPLLSSKDEPVTPFSSSCSGCPFKEYCFKDVPHPCVLDLHDCKKKYEYYNDGVISYTDVLMSDLKLSARKKVQIDSYLTHQDVIIDKKQVALFLTKLRYPLYHLDFESIMLPIPPCDDAWPYEQIPTQYSLHIEYEDGRLEHKEFLGDSVDPRRSIAESLVRDIPDDVVVTAYNKNFECSRLQELADLFPDLREHLLKIKNNVVDLIIPFQSGAYYHKDMGGSNSIKAVLPALYPNDPELDYHALPVVHNGAEAMDIYPKMLAADPETKQKIREGLLLYCCLDTLAMVKVLRRVKEDGR